jgi:hypothetical protein
MDEQKDYSVKPDVSAPLKKRDSYLRVMDDEPTLVTVDNVEEVNITTDTGIKKGVKVECRIVIYNKTEGSYHPEQEPKIKESYSTSTWYLLKDFQSASHWPKTGIFYWVWKASDGLRWEEA